MGIKWKYKLARSVSCEWSKLVFWRHRSHTVRTMHTCLCIVQYMFGKCTKWNCKLYNMSCEICLCVLYKCLAPSLRLSLTLDNGPSVSGSALLIEFLHRGHYLNESCKKRPQLWSFAKTPPQSLIFFLAL